MGACSSDTRARRTLAGLAIAGSFLAACDGPGHGLPIGEERGGAAAAPAAEPAGSETPPRMQAHDLPDTIYYDLTRFDWYARAEPLRFEGADYTPGASLLAASATEMEKVGSYEGVAVYRWNHATDSALYVPVFEGFWLPFVRALPIQ